MPHFDSSQAPALPQEDLLRDARYLTEDGRDGYPVGGIKSAMVRSCIATGDMMAIEARGAFQVNPGEEIVPIEFEGPAPFVRQDSVEVGGEERPIFRPEYRGWSIPIELHVNMWLTTVEQVISWLEAAGVDDGIGVMSPRRGGDHGTFTVKKVKGKKKKMPKDARPFHVEKIHLKLVGTAPLVTNASRVSVQKKKKKRSRL